MKLFSVTDGTQQRLVRPRGLTLFKPALRQFLTQNALGSHKRALGSTQTVIKQLEEHKKETQLVNSSMLQTKTTGKGWGKHGPKGAKKGAARGSKGKGKGKNRKSKSKGATKPVAASDKKKEDKTVDSTQSQGPCKF